jgi:hypothetical protein
MIYFYLSNISHLHHYFRCAEFNDTCAVSISKPVIDFFERQNIQCIRTIELEMRASTPNKIVINDLIAILSKKVKSDDKFVFTERLMDYGGLLLAKELAMKKVVPTEYWENLNVTEGYVGVSLLGSGLRVFARTLKYSLKYGILFRSYRAHDNEYLGVSREKLQRWGVRCERLSAGSPNFIFDYSAKWRIKANSDSGHRYQLFAIGYSIIDESGFYPPQERKVILERIIENFPSLKIKYPPASVFTSEYPKNLQVDHKLLIEELLPSISLLISDYSTSLLVASKMGVQAVSILDMVEVTDSVRHKFWKQYLEAGCGVKPILFPKNMNELLKICNLYKP